MMPVYVIVETREISGKTAPLFARPPLGTDRIVGRLQV
jgi:hypothetical protein